MMRLKKKLLRASRFLLVRTDRIGDVILAMPVASALKKARPEAHVSLLCRRETAVFGERNPDIDAVFTVDRENGTRRDFFELVRRIREEKFDCAVVIHPEFYLAVLLAVAGVGIRIGTGYRFYSLLFNRRHYEHRKASIKHEADYNLGLLKALDIEPTIPEFKFVITDDDRKKADSILEQLGVGGDQPFCLIHPGSGGSAMDWPSACYAGSCSLFSSKLNLQVLVSWGAGERELAETVKNGADGGAAVLPEVYSLPVLAALLKKAEFLLAPSTGILHLANTVGTPVIGLYPPVKHESPTRWGPYGNIDLTIVPDKNECLNCKGEKCKKISCMELITIDMVINHACGILAKNAAKEKQSEAGNSIHT